MSRTRTLEFNIVQRVRCVVDQEYIAQCRILYPELAAAVEDDEEFIETVLSSRIQLNVQDGADRLSIARDDGTSLIRVRAPLGRIRRTDNFTKVFI